MSQEILGYKFGVDATEAKASVGSFKKELREATKNLIEMADKFGESSDQAIKAAKRVAELKDKIGDAKSMAEAFNPDARFKAVSQSVQGIAGAFAAVQGAMAVFGVESEDLQKQLLRVQGALALSEGLNTFLDTGIQGLKNLKAVAIDAFKGIKTAIGSTGIGLLVVALGTIVAYWDDIKRAVSGVSKEQENSYNKAKASANIEKEKVDNLNKQDNILKLQGKSEKDILNIKIAQTDQAITAYEAQLKAQKAMQDAQYKTALRNREILEGTLRWLQIPLTAILGTIDLIGKAFGKDFGLEKAFIGWEASFLIDPKEIKKNGEDANKELEKTLLDLRNTQAGYKLQVKELDKKDNDERKAKNEKNAKEEADKLKEQEEKKKDILDKAKVVIAEKDKTDREKDLYELDAKYKEELKLFKDGSEEKKKVQEAYDIERRAINDKYDKEDSEKNAKNLREALDGEEAKLNSLIDNNDLLYSARKQAIDNEQALLDEAYRNKLLSEKEYTEKSKGLSDKRKQIDKAERDSKINSWNEISGALGMLSGAMDEGTDLQKGFALTQLAIDTGLAISGLTASTNSPSADNVATGGLAGFAKYAVGIAKILANIAQARRLIQGANKSGGESASSGSSAPVTPMLPVQQTITQLNSGSINALGNQAIKAYVLESDITGSQNRATRILNSSRFK